MQTKTKTKTRMKTEIKTRKRSLKGISGILLAYNEEGNIKKAITGLRDSLRIYSEDYEIIIVLYEKSTDRTEEIINRIRKKDNKVHLVIQHSDRSGYGNALRIGIENATMPWIFFSDSDNQFDMKDIRRLIEYTGEYDIITGQRTNRKDPLIRIIIAKNYNRILRLFIRTGLKDVDCAFKLFKAEIFDKIQINLSTGMVNAEIITKARKEGFRIKETPVPHYERFSGRPVFETGRWSIIKPGVVLGLLKEMKELWKEIRKKN